MTTRARSIRFSEPAAGSGAADAARVLLQAGADVTVKGFMGRTPLHYAAEDEDAFAARVLLQAGADVNARAKNGKTPLDFVDSPDTRSLLLDHGAR